MIEVKEILRQWLPAFRSVGIPLSVGVDRNTLRSHVEIAGEHGFTPRPDGIAALTDERFEDIPLALAQSGAR